MKRPYAWLLALTFCSALQGGIFAQTALSTQPVPPQFQPTQLEVTPYVWGLQINSDDQLGSQSLNAELSLGRILHNLTGLAEIEVVPRYKHAFVFGDGIYASLDPRPKQAISGVDHINLQAGLATVAAGYSFGPFVLNREAPKPVYVSFSPFAGAQYTDMDVTARSATPSTVAHLAVEWWAPTVGGRIDMQRGPYLARVEGDDASFQSNRNGEQVLAAVGYQSLRQKLLFPSVNVGYRYLYEKNALTTNAVLRLKLQGPIIFFTFHL